MNLLKALATVSSMTLVSRILGFVRDALIARVFGAGGPFDEHRAEDPGQRCAEADDGEQSAGAVAQDDQTPQKEVAHAARVGFRTHV